MHSEEPGSVVVAGKIPIRLLDRLSGLYLAEWRRVIAFVVVGASCAIINLACVWAFTHQHSLPYVVYVTIATAISTFASFLLNDFFTFRSLVHAGHPWHYRFLRFHSAAALGAVLTVGLSTLLYHLLHMEPVLAQFIAIIVAAGVNFLMHRIWTYRSVRVVDALTP